jgi:hypothetical protein
MAMSNAQIQTRTSEIFNRDPNPRMGDFVIRKDGTWRRIALCNPRWSKHIQTTTKE